MDSKLLDTLTKDCDVLLFSLLVMDHTLQKELWLSSREGSSCQAELAQYHIPSLNQREMCTVLRPAPQQHAPCTYRGLCLNPAVHPSYHQCPNLMWLHQQVEDWCNWQRCTELRSGMAANELRYHRRSSPSRGKAAFKSVVNKLLLWQPIHESARR